MTSASRGEPALRHGYQQRSDAPTGIQMDGNFLAGPSTTARPIRETLKAALDEAGTLPPEDLPGFLGDLEAIRVSAWARLVRPTPTEYVADELLDVHTAAARL